jgi:hypothetical protein
LSRLVVWEAMRMSRRKGVIPGKAKPGAAWSAAAGVLLTGTAGHPQASGSPARPAATHQVQASTPPPARRIPPASALPPAAAAAAFTGDLQAAVAGGQMTSQAGQDLFGHLQQLLFGPPGQNAQQIQQQYQQLVQAYDQHQSQGQITGPAAARLRHALQALGAALGVL